MPNLEPDIEKGSLSYTEDLLFVRFRKRALKLAFFHCACFKFTVLRIAVAPSHGALIREA